MLDEVPPHLVPDQLVAEARRAGAVAVALYVVDIDGSHLLRLAGSEDFPDRLEAPPALGPEIVPEGLPAFYARLQDELPGCVAEPLWLRGRVLGLLVCVGMPVESLADIATQGAAALELANDYTDFIEAARRRKPTSAAAEIQQNLFPPRIARIAGAQLAGALLPSYEVGGDWFDFVENRDGAWLAIADAAGKGPTSPVLSPKFQVQVALPTPPEGVAVRMRLCPTTGLGTLVVTFTVSLGLTVMVVLFVAVTPRASVTVTMAVNVPALV